MRRYLVHLKNIPWSPKDAPLLLNKARTLMGDKDIVVRDVRVSKKYIEYDLSISNEQTQDAAFEKLASISQLASIEEVVERHLPKEVAIKLAIGSFNDEKYWSAHELLEGVWKLATGEEKSILNGIILIAAAFVHDEKGETEICIAILRRALAKIKNVQGSYFGIDIDGLVNKVIQIIDSGRITRFSI